jgi:gluconokinase
MVSASGLWDQNANDYDSETLRAVNIDRAQLADPANLDQPLCELLPQYREMWPSFDRIPWFPALGDGACSNLGCGCVSPDRLALMVGTTGAMRAVIETDRLEIAPGLWCYRVDRKRFITGGALSNGGDVFAWMKRTLVLPKDLEAHLEKAAPGDHGLTLLPFFSGERSPYWRADLRGVIAGLTQSTAPLDILRASLESVALRFRQISEMLAARFGAPAEIVATGGALLNSPAWTQMMADAIGRPLIACTEPEASCRGAAVWALEQIGVIASIGAVPASLGATFDPRREYSGAYDRLLADQQVLFQKIYES